MNRRTLWLTGLVIFFTLYACKDKITVETEQTLKDWTGKTVYFPNND
jgi:hypothetical protein